jgi:alpha-D-ribose 1-methylphosphonate 5-triphosphate diphosphatase
MVGHDVQCAAAGVTTLLDAVCLGDIGFEKARVQTSRDALDDLYTFANSGLLKSDHYLHLRCELPAEDMLELLNTAIVHPATLMVSVMDHSPGMGQYADISYYRALRRSEGFSEADIDSILTQLQERRHTNTDRNRRGLFASLAGRNLAIASHDDRTEDEVQKNQEDGITISEFPVTMEAARAAHQRGMGVIAGAPNIVRGGSHSGNVAAADMVREGLVSALASDYVPAALIEASFRLVCDEILGMPDAVALISSKPARMVGLTDRGQIAPGFRADLVRVRVHDNLPIVRQVWRCGERVI